MVKPILFNTDMVRAILAGKKTVTRRVIKARGKRYNGETIEEWLKRWNVNPPYQPGDILYVRETWNYGYIETSDIPESRESWFEPTYSDCGDYIKALSQYFYKADNDYPEKEIGMIWRPSIHMPKDAARIWLKVTNVRVKRLQDITWQQAADEGCQGSTSDEPDPLFHIPTLKGEFKKLWDSTIKKSDLDRYGWSANPYVWVIEFERCEKPEPCVIAGMESAEDKRPCIGYRKTDINDEPCEMRNRCDSYSGYEEEDTSTDNKKGGANE